MNEPSDMIKSALALANDSYASGYKEGYTQGQRDAMAAVTKIIEETTTARVGEGKSE